MCWPVPLATSSTVPRAGSTRRNTARIGALFRSGAGYVMTPEDIGWLQSHEREVRDDRMKPMT
jgi:hypothetical protein